MACNCTETTPCTQTDCSCPVKDLSFDCLLWSDDDLVCSGILSGMTGTELIKALDAFICTKYDLMVNYFQLVNIGGGAEVYEGTTLIGQKQLRTIISEDLTLLDVVQNTDTIGIKAGTVRLEFVSDILSLIINTLAGDTVLTTIDLSGYNYDTFAQTLSFVNGTQILTITRNNAEPDLTADLGFLNNHVESGVFNTSTNAIDLTLTDATVVSVTIPNATEVISGILEVATQAEANALTVDDKIITPAKIPISTTTQQGIVELATQAESDALSDATRAVTPGTIPIASETQQGVIRIATQVEVDAGVVTDAAVTPATLASAIGGGSILYTEVSLNTWSYASTTSVAHNIGSPPIAVLLRAVCTVANGGYSIGDVISLSANGHSYEDAGSGDDGGITFTLHDNNNADVLIADRIIAVLKTGSSVFTLTNTSWDLRIVFIH